MLDRVKVNMGESSQSPRDVLMGLIRDAFSATEGTEEDPVDYALDALYNEKDASTLLDFSVRGYLYSLCSEYKSQLRTNAVQAAQEATAGAPPMTKEQWREKWRADMKKEARYTKDIIAIRSEMERRFFEEWYLPKSVGNIKLGDATLTNIIDSKNWYANASQRFGRRATFYGEIERLMRQHKLRVVRDGKKAIADQLSNIAAQCDLNGGSDGMI